VRKEGGQKKKTESNNTTLFYEKEMCLYSKKMREIKNGNKNKRIK